MYIDIYLLESSDSFKILFGNVMVQKDSVNLLNKQSDKNYNGILILPQMPCSLNQCRCNSENTVHCTVQGFKGIVFQHLTVLGVLIFLHQAQIKDKEQ